VAVVTQGRKGRMGRSGEYHLKIFQKPTKGGLEKKPFRSGKTISQSRRDLQKREMCANQNMLFRRKTTKESKPLRFKSLLFSADAKWRQGEETRNQKGMYIVNVKEKKNRPNERRKETRSAWVAQRPHGANGVGRR